MTEYFIKIEVEEGQVKRILERLQKAQKEIYKCYNELEEIGVLTITKKEAENDPHSENGINRKDKNRAVER